MHSVLNCTSTSMIGWLLHYAQDLYLKGSTFESWPTHRLNIMRLCSDPLGHMPELHYCNSDTAKGTARLLNNSMNYLKWTLLRLHSKHCHHKDLLNSQSGNLAISWPRRWSLLSFSSGCSWCQFNCRCCHENCLCNEMLHS